MGIFCLSFGPNSGEVVGQYPGRSSGTEQMIGVLKKTVRTDDDASHDSFCCLVRKENVDADYAWIRRRRMAMERCHVAQLTVLQTALFLPNVKGALASSKIHIVGHTYIHDGR